MHAQRMRETTNNSLHAQWRFNFNSLLLSKEAQHTGREHEGWLALSLLSLVN